MNASTLFLIRCVSKCTLQTCQNGLGSTLYCVPSCSWYYGSDGNKCNLHIFAWVSKHEVCLVYDMVVSLILFGGAICLDVQTVMDWDRHMGFLVY